jgi:hypothetical protein
VSPAITTQSSMLVTVTTVVVLMVTFPTWRLSPAEVCMTGPVIMSATMYYEYDRLFACNNVE